MSHATFFARRCIAGVVALMAAIVGPAAAQTAPGCGSPADCATSDQIWVAAAQIHEIKNQFVVAVRQLTEALAGTYGDEGRALSSSLESMDRAHARWEASITEYERGLAALAESAEVHAALGTVYLDRGRIDDALRELSAAGRMDPRRSDVSTLSALAYEFTGNSADAVRALRNAAMLDGGNPIIQYNLGHHLTRLGRDKEASDALRTFHELQWMRLGGRGRAAATGAPFDRARLLRQAAGVAPIFPLHAYRRGFERLVAGDHAEAIAEFRRAAALDPLVVGSADNPDPVVVGATALRRGDVAAGLKSLEAVVATAPDRAEAHRVLAGAYWVAGQDQKSVDQLNEAIRLTPGDERSRVRLVDVLEGMSRASEAEQALNDLRVAIPDSGLAHYRLGQVDQARALLPRAVAEFETAATLDPLIGLDRLYETIGSLYVTQLQFEQAVNAYVKRIDANPNNAEAHRNLADIYFLQGRDDETLAEFLAALLIDPRDSKAYAGASQVLVRIGRYADAVEAARSALALDADNKEARFALATALMRLGDGDEGRKELEIFRRLQADAMAATDRRSALNAAARDAARSLSNGEYAAAAALIRKALTYDAGSASLYRDLGAALVKAGQYEDAIPALRKAIELEDSAETHQFLADAYTALGRLDNSRAEVALSLRVAGAAKANRLRQMNGRQ